MYTHPSPKSSHVFSQVPEANIPRSKFDRSHNSKTTLDASGLVPIFVDEVLPGDTLNLQATLFARLSTPIKPLMDNLYLETFFFFVPNRLVWKNWERFNGAQDKPADSVSFVVPSLTIATWTEMTLADYFGLPTKKPIGGASSQINALPFRAYNLIWDNWFRDENLQDGIIQNLLPLGDGPDTAANYTLLSRGKRHDYFTSSLPWTQKATAVTVPLGTTAPVLGNNTNPNMFGVTSAVTGNMRVTNTAGAMTLNAGSNFTANEDIRWGTNSAGASTGLVADLTNAAAATINSLRQAFQIQRLYERDARGGTRYTEILLSHFGVVSPDFRLQRPEYLGGGSTPLNVTPVPQTSVSAATPQGNLAGYGTVLARNNGFVKSFVEHGYVIGLASVRADMGYQQGQNRMWTRSTRFDFYWPSLSHLGEQAVLNSEIYYNDDSADDNVWGYQERYAEYRYKPSFVTGLFRSNATGTLDIWHTAQNFTSRPALNAAFIIDSSSVTLDRNIVTPTEPQFIMDMYFKYICARPMPVYSVPGLIDHF